MAIILNHTYTLNVKPASYVEDAYHECSHCRNSNVMVYKARKVQSLPDHCRRILGDVKRLMITTDENDNADDIAIHLPQIRRTDDQTKRVMLGLAPL